MEDFNRSRVSVVATQVATGREDDFLALVDELHGLIRQRGYGSDRLLQDGSNPRLYYHFRTWTSPEAAARCADDPEVQSLWSQLEPTMRITHLVGMARPVVAWAAVTRSRIFPGDRRFIEDRRAPAERRTVDLRPPGSDRRGDERRSGADRREAANRRTAESRRSARERRARAERRAESGTAPEQERRSAERRIGEDRRAGPDRRSGGVAEQTNDITSGRPTGTLVIAARAGRLRAHAAFSQFKVGAALETADGSIITGCNLENATYGLTICAERVAMFKALSEGHRHFTRIAVVADTKDPTPPCGACRQILWEFGGDLEVILANLSGEQARHRLKELLPLPFDARMLNEGP